MLFKFLSNRFSEKKPVPNRFRYKPVFNRFLTGSKPVHNFGPYIGWTLGLSGTLQSKPLEKRIGQFVDRDRSCIRLFWVYLPEKQDRSRLKQLPVRFPRGLLWIVWEQPRVHPIYGPFFQKGSKPVKNRFAQRYFFVFESTVGEPVFNRFETGF